jgi:hypothetical protein
MTLLAAADKGAGDTRLVLAAILGIALVVVLITWLKVHPFLALILGSPSPTPSRASRPGSGPPSAAWAC